MAADLADLRLLEEVADFGVEAGLADDKSWHGPVVPPRQTVGVAAHKPPLSGKPGTLNLAVLLLPLPPKRPNPADLPSFPPVPKALRDAAVRAEMDVDEMDANPGLWQELRERYKLCYGMLIPREPVQVTADAEASAEPAQPARHKAKKRQASTDGAARTRRKATAVVKASC